MCVLLERIGIVLKKRLAGEAIQIIQGEGQLE